MGESLLQQVAAGNVGAMQQCIEQYGGLIWSLSRRMTASSTDAEEVVQEIFVSLWESAARFDPQKGNEASFVAMIARRRLIDHVRSSTRRKRLVESVRNQSDPLPAIDNTGSRTDIEDEVKQVLQAIAKLNENQQRVLHLAIHHGLTQEEIAEVTDLPLGTVKTNARRGMIRVRELLSASATNTPRSEAAK